MKTKPKALLSDEDRILWSRVARSAKPLPGKAYPEIEAQPPIQGFQETPIPSPVVFHTDAPATPGRKHPRRLDAPTREKLARGRIDIVGRVDLHGLTQAEAHSLLLSFLRQAFAAERRYVLVITGKGRSSGEGVLRRAVPQWFSTPPFSDIVGGFEEASRHHGGGGALYVRLRKLERRR